MNSFRLKVRIESYALNVKDDKSYDVSIVPSTTVGALKQIVRRDKLYVKPSYFKIFVLDSRKDQNSR